MPFGAHEVMQTQEILSEKVNLINHFSLYAGQVQDVQLKNMLDRHIRSAMESYNTLVSYTHDYAAADQMVPLDSTQPVYTNPVQYGLRQPAPQSPQLGLSFLTDRQAAGGDADRP